ncbi:minor capsid protein [Lactobacillus sp. ESL0681]|uniref:minor capsid protein n=1 Tax=Lactobacillus sp. ESL0681 TaxID=2983211 RepID=UPI0023F9B1D4|nr:minor capsid protein [Lactobacillus sp. ESL0681]WEV40350.1 minor capsid protein [Lactobacillus sp. ESL0681]
MTKKQTLRYWQQRQLDEKQRQLDNATDYEIALRSRMKSLFVEIQQETDKFMKRYAANNDISVGAARKLLAHINTTNWQMTLKEFETKAKAGGFDKELDNEYFKSRIARLQNINEQLQELCGKFADKESGNMGNALANQFQDTYLHQNYNWQDSHNGFSIDFTHFNETQLKQIANQPWQGSNFSKRIWKNYHDVLPDQLTDVLLRGTLLGYSSQRVTRMLQDRFVDIQRKQIHRLVITEMGHVAEEATASFYEDSKIERYEYMATLESHTCEECGYLDGKIFNVKDRIDSENYPLIHPYCRCTTVPYDENLPDIETRWMRDPETGKGRLVDSMSFQDWKKQYVDHTDIKIENRAVRMEPKKNGKYEWNELNAEAYNKHVKGTPEFDNYAKGRKKPISELILSAEEVQKLINKYGYKEYDQNKNKVLFTDDSYIGQWASIDGKLYPTKNGRIGYSKKKGCHVTPQKPDYLE